MIASGWIETTPGGKIDPSAAVAALLRRDHEGHALKALPQIRTRLAEAESIREDALATVRQMEQARDHANKARLAAEREQSRLARVALELELALELMRPTAGDDPVDQAIERAMRTSLERMSEAMLDPDLLAKAAAAEPTVEQRIDALALRVEQAEAANDPRIDRFRADLFLAQFRAQPTAEVEDDV
ncbi:MAG: hypothetical protein K9L88_17105 [Chromatiaceae bacterium]|nr:hypothetical protein [Chromatiaceae bacterium]MCF8017321.1 hypothetical protein [Chromatiaceae bacterium]